MRLAVGARTDIGRNRRRNEDSMLVREPLFAVADGMGGHRGGNVASQMSVQTLERASLGHRADGEEAGAAAVLEAIQEANRAVLERGNAESDLQGMGTTMTALLVEGERGHILHVGDSRAYRMRDGALQQLTEDHTLVQEWVRQGRLTKEAAERHPQRSMVTRALGVEEDLNVDDVIVDLEPGDRFVICSDGLSGMLDDDTIAEALSDSPAPQEAADRLVDMANEAGGDDNITVIVVEVLADERDARPGAAATTGRSAPTESVAPATAGVRAEPWAGNGRPSRRRGRRRGRALAVGLLALVVVGALGGFVGVRAVLNGQWYVGTSGDHVAIYRGVPSSLLGLRLSRLERVTPIPAGEAVRFQRSLGDGITTGSRAAALRIVRNIQQELCRSQNSTCIPGGLGG